MKDSACQRKSEALARGGSRSLVLTRRRDADGTSPHENSLSGIQSPPVYSFKPIATPLFLTLSASADDKKVTTVVAPPGYGKTVLLSELYYHYARSGAGCRWIGLEDRDNSLGGLLTMLENAVGITNPGRPRTGSLHSTDAGDRIEAIRSQLAQWTGSLVVFIDNIDFCREATVDQLLNALVFNTPKSVRLFVSSSSGPIPFNAGRARLESLLFSVTSAELSFDQASTASLFAQAGFPNIASHTLEAIVRKTEGWPAAVRLLQLVGSDQSALDRGVELLCGDDAHIADILSHRLMASLKPDLVQFLYQICEFRRFSAPLAQEATSDERAPLWIDFLVERNFLIIPADNKREWFRFHGLFREFLVKEARRHLPAPRRAKVHVAAARWLAKRGDVVDALELALNIKDLAMASELLDATACLLVREQGDTAAFIGWLERAEQAGVKKRVQATFWHVWALLFERRFRAAREAARQASADITRRDDFSDELGAKLGIVEVIAALHLDAPEAVRASAEGWLAAHPNGDPFDIAAAAGATACSRLANFEFTAARNSLLIAQEALARSSTIYGRCWIAMIAAMIEIAQGNPATVEHRLLESELRARSEIAPAEGIASVVAIVRAAVLYDLGRLDEARQLVVANLERAAHNGILDTTWLGIDLALACSVSGDAPFSIADLRRIARDYPKRLSVLLELKIIRLDLLLEHKDDGLDLARDLGWSAKAGWPSSFLSGASEMERGAASLTSASLLIACGRLCAAAELVQRELRSAQEDGRRKVEIELLLLNADLQMRLNARTVALRCFSRAICVSAKRKLFGPFLERRSAVAHLLENARIKELGLTSREEIAAYAEIARLTGASFPMAEGPKGFGAPADPLTPREMELLRHLEAGLDNVEIAERTAVTVRTIKWHLSNLYAKLEVKNRSSAVAKGRSLRLLQK